VITTSTPGLEAHAVRRSLVRARWPIPDGRHPPRAVGRRARRPPLPGGDLDVVAMRYRFGAGGVAGAARSRGAPRPRARRRRAGLPDVVAGVRTTSPSGSASWPAGSRSSQSWDELVLAPDILDDVGR
jgi:hypothetical protein